MQVKCSFRPCACVLSAVLVRVFCIRAPPHFASCVHREGGRERLGASSRKLPANSIEQAHTHSPRANRATAVLRGPQLPTHTHTPSVLSLSPRSYLPSPVSCFPFPYPPSRLPSPVPFSSPRAYGGPSVVSNFVRDNLDPTSPSSPHMHINTRSHAPPGGTQNPRSPRCGAPGHCCRTSTIHEARYTYGACHLTTYHCRCRRAPSST
ncbi:hypothetical protein C8Q74DRAFT_55725 [Fomes fomentarius]|nr:hypothetical protein C8Q74DRAFT_55725 [Fomes fomentarius]